MREVHIHEGGKGGNEGMGRKVVVTLMHKLHAHPHSHMHTLLPACPPQHLPTHVLALTLCDTGHVHAVSWLAGNAHYHILK